MRKVRKDSHGRVLRTGEFERYDGIYVFQKTVCGNKKTIYASSLEALRQKVSEAIEYRFDELGKNLKSITLDKAFERFMLSRIIRNTTAYVQRNLYDHYIKKRLGKKKVNEITHSDIRQLLMEHSLNRFNCVQ